MTTEFDYDAVRHQLVTAAAELKSNGHDVRAILEDCGVFRKVNKYRELSVDGLLKDYYLKDDIQEIDTPKYVKHWGAAATCRGNIYKRGKDGKPDKLIRGAWNGALTYRICTVTGVNQQGERVQRGIQYHTVAFALANGRWPETPVVDHLDDNKLNNGSDNLTEKDYTTNQWQRKANLAKQQG